MPTPITEVDTIKMIDPALPGYTKGYAHKMDGTKLTWNGQALVYDITGAAPMSFNTTEKPVVTGTLSANMEDKFVYVISDKGTTTVGGNTDYAAQFIYVVDKPQDAPVARYLGNVTVGNYTYTLVNGESPADAKYQMTAGTATWMENNTTAAPKNMSVKAGTNWYKLDKVTNKPVPMAEGERFASGNTYYYELYVTVVNDGRGYDYSVVSNLVDSTTPNMIYTSNVNGAAVNDKSYFANFTANTVTWNLSNPIVLPKLSLRARHKN